MDPLTELPDLPRWIEARAILLHGCGQVFTSGHGWAVRNERPGGELVVAIGRPSAECLREALADRPDRSVLCSVDDAEAVGARLPGWTRESAQLFRLAQPDRLLPPDPDVRPLVVSDALTHLEPDLEGEIAVARDERPVFAAFHDGKPVAFAYAYWETESLFDISIDTVPEARRAGHGSRAVSALIRHQRQQEREPVWGAMESNPASAAMARRLGFEPIDEVVLWQPGSTD